jgi:hypothetical protein
MRCTAWASLSWGNFHRTGGEKRGVSRRFFVNRFCGDAPCVCFNRHAVNGLARFPSPVPAASLETAAKIGELSRSCPFGFRRRTMKECARRG